MIRKESRRRLVAPARRTAAMEHLPLITAAIISLVTIGYGSRVVYVAAERLLEGTAAGPHRRAEMLQNLGFLAALYGLIGNRELAQVGLLLIALGLLLEPETARPARPFEL